MQPIEIQNKDQHIIENKFDPIAAAEKAIDSINTKHFKAKS